MNNMNKHANFVDKFVDKCVYPVENFKDCAKVEKKNLYAQSYQHLKQKDLRLLLQTSNTIHRHY